MCKCGSASFLTENSDNIQPNIWWRKTDIFGGKFVLMQPWLLWRHQVVLLRGRPHGNTSVCKLTCCASFCPHGSCKHTFLKPGLRVLSRLQWIRLDANILETMPRKTRKKEWQRKLVFCAIKRSVSSLKTWPSTEHKEMYHPEHFQRCLWKQNQVF